MFIKAYGYLLKPEHYETIRGMVSIFTTEPVEILDLASYDCNPTSQDIILLFGKIAQHKCVDKPVKAKLEFVEIEKLQRETGEEELRVEAAERLKKFKEIYKSGKLDKTKTWKKEINETREEKIKSKELITEETFPSDYPTADDILALETNLRKKNKTRWQGTTKDGRSICITITPEKRDADINITFAELYAARNLMDTLNIEEIEVVIRPDSNRKDFIK